MDNDGWSSGFVQRLGILQSGEGLSKAKMARRCGLPPRTLENYFKGRKPSIDALLAISRGMAVDVDWLLGDEPESPQDDTAIVEEVAWQGAKTWLDTIVKAAAQGDPVVEGSLILGIPTAELAGKIAANISQKYRKLRSFKHTRIND